MVNTKCCLLSCKRAHEPNRTLFRFPLDRMKRLTWYEAVKADLPDDLTMDTLNNKYICDSHFPSIMYATSGNRKRLFNNACPIKMVQTRPRMAESMIIDMDKHSVATQSQMPESVIVNVNKHSVATQVHFTAKEREIISLKKKISQLVNKMEKLKSDPPASLIYKNRHKLAQYVTEEAYLLFDCAVTNSPRGHHGHRHSMEVKKLTQSIAQKNRMAFKMLKPIFALPSLRTLGRMDNEPSSTTSLDQSSTPEDTSNGDRSTRDESLSTNNFQMDQTPRLENINIDDLHMGNITFVSVPFSL